MVGRGSGYVWVDGERVLNGIIFQCNKCYTFVISENNPLLLDYLGLYARGSANEFVGPGTVLSTNAIYYNSDLSTWTGYTWHY
ncbi:hypothetical protein KO561_06990 [Radiobacillus kanasensis]|uniref:hypothetical protein n=1 Tax=Radiobacillus kanasensis TaxID=2844358 RepID=UPI001E3334EB|nr:hypothetical protein [Radiobacillus kanasensis]UFU00674.1 hypothetical protein KO561_06990 [Radiobacillus kanasensis]